MQNCHHINLLTYYSTYRLQGVLQTIRLFISDWDGWCDWLQTTAEHDVVWSIWAGDHGDLSCAHLSGEWQLRAKSHSWSVPFWLVLLTEHEVLHCYPPNAVYTAAWLLDNCTRLADSLQQTVDASNFPTLVGQFIQQPLCTILLWQIEICN